MSSRAQESHNRIKKRKYSRRGCIECKRRKIKCDEAMPECFNCTRLHKKCFYATGTATTSEDAPLSVASGDPGFVVCFYEPSIRDAKAAKSPPSPTPSSAHGSSVHLESSNTISPAVLSPIRNVLVKNEDQGNPIHPSPQSISHTNAAPSSRPHKPGSYDLPFSSLHMEAGVGMGQESDMENLFTEANLLVTGMNGFMHQASSPRLEESIWEEVKMDDKPGPIAPATHAKAAQQPAAGNVEARDSLKSAAALLYEGPDYSSSCAELPENSGLIAEICAKAKLNGSHIKYLQTLTKTNLSYHLFPFASSIESNEVIKILLNYSINCKYLLNSILAITATFQFNQSGGREHEVLRHKYLEQCFATLKAAFQESLGFQNIWSFTNNVEKLLLTVLVLSSNFTACINDEAMASQWITHLRGARDLLLNYSKIKRRDDSANMSSGLALAKCWFFAIESTAAIHSSVGGSLLKLEESGRPRDSVMSEAQMDEYLMLSEAEYQIIAAREHAGTDVVEDMYQSWPRTLADKEMSKLRQIFQDTGNMDESLNVAYCRALQRAQLLSHQHFNLYWGYSAKIAEAQIQYASVVEESKIRGMAKAAFRWTVHLLGMVDACLQDQMVPHVRPDTFEIPAGTRGHPEYQGSDKLVFKASCYIHEQGVYRSWFDLSNQFHCDNLYIKILTGRQFMALPRLHPDVQSIVRKVFTGSFFIKEKPVEDADDVIVESRRYYLSKKTFDMRCIMIQSVFRALLGIVCEERDFERVELFYQGLVKLGNGSSLSALDMLAKCHKRRQLMREKGLEDEEVFDLYEGLVIPFA